ncbi:helix-turn-helix domain-containing protein [bacterium]|nr:helix-turn-helix domain-containing protein [bacterium]
MRPPRRRVHAGTGGVARASGGFAVLRFLATAPAPALRPHVVMYHQSSTVGDDAHVVSAVPSGRPALVFTLDGRYEAALGSAPLASIPGAIVHGQFTTLARNRFSCGHQGFLVLLQPTGLLGLLGVPAHEITDAYAELDTVAPREAAGLRELADSLREAPDFASRCAIADEVLLRILSGRRRRPPALDVARRGTARIVEAAGTTGVDALASELAVTPRTLRRHFLEAVGLPPKSFAAVTRFNHVVVGLHARPDVDWLDLVHRYGYADQSHLGRDFRRFAGVSPTAYLAAGQILDRELNPPR